MKYTITVTQTASGLTTLTAEVLGTPEALRAAEVLAGPFSVAHGYTVTLTDTSGIRLDWRGLVNGARAMFAAVPDGLSTKQEF